MGGIQTFLESSTIHGLVYISTTRKYARLFWILIVIVGFSTAAYLIQQSFQSWADSPVKTTVETLPMSEITFPKISVCPPKDTFTDLNYDLMSIENVSMTDPGVPVTKNDQLLRFASEVVNDHLYLDDWMRLQEADKFYNWYHGYTRITYPKYEIETAESNYKALQFKYTIDTSALSGVVSTKHFGEEFDYKLVEKFCQFQINLHPPENFNDNNFTLNVYLERATIRESKLVQNIIRLGDDTVGDEQTVVSFKKNKIESSFDIFYSFYASPLYLISMSTAFSDLSDTKMMPGFSVRWWYTYTGTGPKPMRKYLNDRKTKNLRRYILNNHINN